MKIRLKLLIVTGISGITLIAFSFFANLTLNLTKVTGPLYATIIQGKDLIADILPPPEYIIEAYLVTYELDQSNSSDEVETLIAKGDQLKADYEMRQKYWAEDYADGEIKTLLTEESSAYARNFFDIRDTEFIPAIRSGEREKAHRILIDKMGPVYERHRAVIDKIVELQTKKNTADEKNVMEIIKWRVLLEIILTVIAFGVSVGASLVIAVQISRGLSSLNQNLREIAEGDADLTREIDVQTRDEIGTVAQSFNLFLGKLRSMIENFNGIGAQNSETAADIAQSTEQLSTSANEITTTMNSFVEMQNELNQEIQGSATSLDRITASASDTSDLITNQAALIKETSVSVKSFIYAVDGVSAIAREKGEAAVLLGNQARSGADEMSETTLAIREISSAAGAILDMLKVIDEVAEKTNLLALNAAIEAAHAGDSGRGFAVVADEVRRLAVATSQNASTIGISLKETIARIQSAAVRTEKTNTSIHGLMGGIHQIDAGMNDIRQTLASIFEQSDGIEKSLGALLEISQRTRGSMESVNAETREIRTSIVSIKNLSAQSIEGAREILSGMDNVNSTITTLTETGRVNEQSVQVLQGEIGKFRT